VMSTHGRTGPGRWLLGSRELVLVRVDRTPHDVKVAEVDVLRYLEGAEDESDREVQEYLRASVQRVNEGWPDLRASSRTALDEASTGIAAIAAQCEAALIVMATHGRTGLRRTVVGSVAGQLLEHGKIPLVLVGAAASAAKSELSVHTNC